MKELFETNSFWFLHVLDCDINLILFETRIFDTLPVFRIEISGVVRIPDIFRRFFFGNSDFFRNF
jgi:hypothetical protein